LGKEDRGLRVKSIREFNLALLGKLCWRLLVDRESLWFRLLVVRYDLVEGRLLARSREGSMWWREIAAICDCHGSKVGCWFSDN